MSAATLVSLEDYLATSYRPDCDYADGVLTERNVGQKDHSKLQTSIWLWFYLHRQLLPLMAFVEQRIRVSTLR